MRGISHLLSAVNSNNRREKNIKKLRRVLKLGFSKLERIAQKTIVLLLTVVLLSGSLMTHASDPAYEPSNGTDLSPGLMSNTINNKNIADENYIQTLSDLSDPEALAEAENACRERMQRERAEAILADSKISNYVNTEEFFETKPMFR